MDNPYSKHLHSDTGLGRVPIRVESHRDGLEPSVSIMVGITTAPAFSNDCAIPGWNGSAVFCELYTYEARKLALAIIAACDEFDAEGK